MKTKVRQMYTRGGNPAPNQFLLYTSDGKIGRASCRERVYISVVAVSLKKKKREERWKLYSAKV